MPKFARTFEAALGGITVGERAFQGDKMRAAMLGLTLAVPLLWKKRLAQIALMGAAALVSYYFFEEFHEREFDLEVIEAPHKPSMN